jgi:O-antigen/teichoic acid export membrane protein
LPIGVPVIESQRQRANCRERCAPLYKDLKMSKSAANLMSLSIARFIAHWHTPLYRNAYALTFSSAATSGLGIVYWLLAARFYPAHDVGLNSAAISTMVFLSGLSQLNLTAALIRFIPRMGSTTGRFVGYSYLISLALAAVVSVVFIVGLNIWAPALGFLQADRWLALWFIIATMIWGVFTLQDSVLTGLRQTMWVPIENAIFGVAKIALLIIFTASSQQYGIFASWTIPALVAVVPINLLIFRRLISKHIVATETLAAPIALRPIIKFVAANYVAFVLGTIPMTLIPLMVISQVGASANAYFYLASTIAFSIQLISANMATSFTVEGAADEAALGVYGRRALIHLARLLTPMILIVLIGAPYILRIFGADYAVEGAAALRLLALSTIPGGIISMYLGFARVRHRTIGLLLVAGVECALTLGLSYLWLPIYAITGIGMAWLTSQAIVAAAIMLLQLGPRIRLAMRQEHQGSN